MDWSHPGIIALISGFLAQTAKVVVELVFRQSIPGHHLDKPMDRYRVIGQFDFLHETTVGTDEFLLADVELQI